MKICALIPFYNHPDAIGFVVDQLLTYDLNIIIVDDELITVTKCFPK